MSVTTHPLTAEALLAMSSTSREHTGEIRFVFFLNS